MCAFNQMYKLLIPKFLKIVIPFDKKKWLLKLIVPVNNIFMIVFSIQFLECLPTDNSFSIMASTLTLLNV